jgi:hypothetical protein
MAGRLLSQSVAGSQDVPLVVWNRTAAKCDELAARFPGKHIQIKGTPKEVVESCR